jgi:tetratricopeptide (TPR) repeat protein
MTARFCPQCGAKILSQANFCAACGKALPGTAGTHANRTQAVAASSRSMLVPGFVVFSLYLLIGTGLWVFVLRSQPFPAPTASSGEGQASTGGSALPQEHPQVSLPEEAKKLLAGLAEKANAAPQDIKTWKTLAEAQSRAARLDSSYRSAAFSSYRHVLELAPNDLEALRGVGNIYYDFEEYAKAIDYYQKYLALSPEDANVRTDLGTMYLYTNDTDRAIAEYQKVIAQKPEFFQAYFNMGIAYQERGESDKAQQALTQAKALTADKNIQTRIDQVIAQFGGTASPTPATASATTAARSPFQQTVERLFRSHEIMGPRVSRIEWPAAAEAHVFFQNFPMSAMPQEVRERFLGKLRTQVTDAKNANSISETAKIELIDADTNQVMETIVT